MTTDTPNTTFSDLRAGLAEIDEQILRQFAALCRDAQLRAIAARSPRLADWFQGVALIIRDERNRRAENGRQPRVPDPDGELLRFTRALSDRDIEAVAMGFGRMLEKARPDLRAQVEPLTELFYEPVRVEAMTRAEEMTDEP